MLFTCDDTQENHFSSFLILYSDAVVDSFQAEFNKQKTRDKTKVPTDMRQDLVKQHETGLSYIRS